MKEFEALTPVPLSQTTTFLPWLSMLSLTVQDTPTCPTRAWLSLIFKVNMHEFSWDHNWQVQAEACSWSVGGVTQCKNTRFMAKDNGEGWSFTFFVEAGKVLFFIWKYNFHKLPFGSVQHFVVHFADSAVDYYLPFIRVCWSSTTLILNLNISYNIWSYNLLLLPLQ